MHIPHITLYLPLVLQCAANVVGVRLAIQGREKRSPHQRLGKRGISLLDNDTNFGYYTNITLGGSNYEVSIDTGSSDLWVVGPVPNARDSGATAEVQYAIGGVEGSVKFATLELLGSIIEDQAFLEADINNIGIGEGLIGLGPFWGSSIYEALGEQPVGDPPLDSIFRQNASAPNILTVLLDRSNDPGNPYPGDMSIGELLPGYDAITEQPQLPVTLNPGNDVSNQHWQLLLDEDGVIGPDGQPAAVVSGVPSTQNKAQLTVVFDTGFTFPQVLPSVAESFYSGIEGAQFDSVSNFWIIPCTAEVNVAFKFGGVSYPIHPLDMSSEIDDPSYAGSCIGQFQPITFNGDPDLDMILGMSFLRNVYLLINAGDFVDQTSNKANPYIQLLSTTNSTAAHLDFVNVRLNGTSSVASATASMALPSSSTSSAYPTPSDVPDDASSGDLLRRMTLVSDSDSPSHGYFEQHRTAVIIGASLCGGLSLLLVASLAFGLYKWREAEKRAIGKSRSRPLSAYRPLYAPAPAGEMEKVEGYGGRGL
ncbi:acid protease [Auriscalpium vulgare]|uniref:Acid protease n=1 Tax=Auriscalpium vulgare TaxID=40419 RepID=A0ACB8S8I6_9AGAM|nr:acid protease [Auriscalpium vulgare]